MHLMQNGIAHEPFYGLDNEVYRVNPIDTFDIDRVGDRIGPKQVCACMSHYLMWKVLSYLPGDSFWCLEDDVELVPNWQQAYRNAMGHVPDDWDIIFLGSCCCDGRPTLDYGGGLYEVKWPMCGHAMQIRQKALPVLLEAHQKLWAPLDIAMYYNSLPNLKVYTILPRMFSQRNTIIPP